MIFIIFSILLVVYSFFKYKKAFLISLIYKVVLVTNITFISVPGIPLLTCEMFLDLCFIIIYLIKFGIPKRSSFPYLIPFAFLGITYFLATIFSISGVNSAISEFVGTITSDILIVMLIWKFVNTKDDYKFIFKWISVIIFISCIYGLYEQFTKSNPLVEWEATFNHDESKTNLWIYYNDSRGWRTQSIFSHAIGAGIIWSCYLTVFLMLCFKYDLKLKNNLFYLITAILCVPCIIFTRSRTPLIFCIISLLSIFGYKKKKTLVLTISCACILAFGFLYLSVTNSVLLNYFDNAYVGGSSLEMRLGQLNHAFNLFKISPISGLGFKYSNVIDNADVQGLLGGESILYEIIPTYGIIGMFSYFVFAVYMCIVIPYKYRSSEIMFISLAYWIANIVSSTPGSKMYLLWLIIFFIAKNPVKKNTKKMQLVYSLNTNTNYYLNRI